MPHTPPPHNRTYPTPHTTFYSSLLPHLFIHTPLPIPPSHTHTHHALYHPHHTFDLPQLLLQNSCAGFLHGTHCPFGVPTTGATTKTSSLASLYVPGLKFPTHMGFPPQWAGRKVEIQLGRESPCLFPVTRDMPASRGPLLPTHTFTTPIHTTLHTTYMQKKKKHTPQVRNMLLFRELDYIAILAVRTHRLPLPALLQFTRCPYLRDHAALLRCARTRPHHYRLPATTSAVFYQPTALPGSHHAFPACPTLPFVPYH